MSFKAILRKCKGSLMALLIEACVKNRCVFLNHLSNRGIRTIAKFRLLTKIDFNVMHLINLSKKIWQKLQIRGSHGLQNSAISDTYFQFLTILCRKNASN